MDQTNKKPNTLVEIVKLSAYAVGCVVASKFIGDFAQEMQLYRHSPNEIGTYSSLVSTVLIGPLALMTVDSTKNIVTNIADYVKKGFSNMSNYFGNNKSNMKAPKKDPIQPPYNVEFDLSHNECFRMGGRRPVPYETTRKPQEDRVPAY